MLARRGPCRGALRQAFLVTRLPVVLLEADHAAELVLRHFDARALAPSDHAVPTRPGFHALNAGLVSSAFTLDQIYPD